MVATSIQQVRPGFKVLTPIEKRGWTLFGAGKKERLILGDEINGQIPVKVSNGKDEGYVLTNKRVLQEIMLAKETEIKPEVDLSSTDENIVRLWSFPGLWNLNDANKPVLNKDLDMWIAFDEDKLLTTMSHDKPNSDSYAQLFVSSENELSIGQRNKMPLEFYGQLEIFNWLIGQFKNK